MNGVRQFTTKEVAEVLNKIPLKKCVHCKGQVVNVNQFIPTLSEQIVTVTCRSCGLMRLFQVSVLMHEYAERAGVEVWSTI